VIYAVVYILLCLLVPLGANRQGKNTTLLAIVSAALFVFVGFRWEVGCDWTGYLNIFELSRGGTIEETLSSREPGFALLNAFIHALELDYYYVNVAASLLFFVGLFLFARRQENPLAVVALSFPVLIINMPMSGVRQGIAVAFFMAAINAFRAGNRWLYAGAVLAGGAFHQSVLLFLGFTPLIKRNRGILTIALAIILSVPAGYYVFTSVVGGYVERYGTDLGDAAGAPIRTAMLAVVGAGFFLMLRKRWRAKFPADYELFAIASFLMLITLPLAFYASIIGDRMGYYLIPFQVVVLQRLPFLFRDGANTQLLAAAPYVALLAFLVLWMNLSPLFEGCYLPYRSVLISAE
jgi:hypothetical protein